MIKWVMWYVVWRIALYSLRRAETNRTNTGDSCGIACHVRYGISKYNELYDSDGDDIIWLDVDGTVF